MKRTVSMLAAIMLPFAALCSSYTNSFVRDGVTYVQRGGLTIKDYVVTNVVSGGVTTNDVKLTPVYSNTPIYGLGDWSVSAPSNAIYDTDNLSVRYEEVSPDEYSWWLYNVNEVISISPSTDNPDATNVEWTLDVVYTATRELVRIDIIGYTLGNQTDKVLASTNSLTSSSITTNDVKNIGDSRWQSILPYATNAIPVTAVSNALSRAEAKAGFTEWVCTPATYDGKTLHVENDNGEWKLYADNQFLDPPEDAPDDATSLTFSVYGVTATRTRLPTMADIPTNNVQIINGAGYTKTNDVCAIVTNNTVGGWSAWTCSPSEYQGFPIVITRFDDGWVPIADGTMIGGLVPDGNVSNLVWFAGDEWAGTEDLVATRTFNVSGNVLGLAGEKGAVSEILMIGSDNKIYHLRIGSGGSIDVYTEAN